MQTERFYFREMNFIRDSKGGFDYVYCQRILENFINLNKISKENLHTIKKEASRINLFFYHSGKLNVDFGEELIKDHLSNYYLYPTCFDSVLDQIRYNDFTDKNTNEAIRNIGHFLNEREADQNFKEWAIQKRYEKYYTEWIVAFKTDIPVLFESELKELFPD